MKAVVFHGVGDIRLDEVEEPHIEQPTDAVVDLGSLTLLLATLPVDRSRPTRPGDR